MKRDCALRSDERHACLQILDDFRFHGFRFFRKQGFGVVDIADERNPIVDNIHRFLRFIFGIIVESGHACLRDVFHPINRAATDVQDKRNRNPFDKFDVQLAEVAVVILAAD